MSNNASLDIIESIREQEKTLVYGKEQLLGKGAVMPNNPANSGSRKILQSTQIEQMFPTLHSETPYLQTGYENEFGKVSSTYIQAEDDMVIIGRINKFNFNNLENHHYYVIVQKSDGEYDIIERISYQHVTETFGNMYDNSYLDSISNQPNAIIEKGATIKKSISYDNNDNRCDGVNLTTAYLAMEHTKEDAIVISESGAKKLEAPLLTSISIQVNDNDIPLNIYGNDNLYKILPDVGENVVDGVVCALRREDGEHILYSQSYNRLQMLMPSDEKYYAKGEIIDINVNTNNEELLENQYYHQLKFYHEEKKRFSQNLIDLVDKIKFNNPNARFSSELNNKYYHAKKIIKGSDYISRNRKFSNIVLEITVMERSKIGKGDKITNRYGGKGCVSKILPDEQMPLLSSGERVELIYTPPSVINRANVGLLLEQSVNFIGTRLLEDLSRLKNQEPYDKWIEECSEELVEFISYVSPSYSSYLYDLFNAMPEFREEFVNSAMADGHLVISVDPASEVMSVNTLMEIYKRFPVDPYTMYVPIKGSNGQYRTVPSRRKMICSKCYIWRLKQYAKDGISAVSLSSTNIRGENSKSNSKKLNKTLYSRTCIRFGEMETGNMLHLSPEVTISNLMINSLSPKARRNYMELLEGDVFDVDIKLDKGCSNRVVEIMNAKLKGIGLELTFNRIPKKKFTMFPEPLVLFEDPDKKKPLELFLDGKMAKMDLFLNQNQPLELFENKNKLELFLPYHPYIRITKD